MPASLVVSGHRLRPIWRASIYLVLVLVALPIALSPVARWLWNSLQLQDSLNPASIAFSEAMMFVAALIATAVFAWFERRRVDSYGLPLGRAFDAPTGEGLAAGIVVAGLAALGMLALGGMQIHGFAGDSATLTRAGLAWLGANIAVGIAEEFTFRGYLLQTLARSIGFWPAALAVTALFVAMHYFFKPGENVYDVITLAGLGLALCYSLLRTGTLWFAVGFHVAFDFMQFFVIGTPNGGQVPVGRLFDVGFDGPAWLTGGTLGTEASVLMYPAIALLWLWIHWRHRGRNAWPSEAVGHSAPRVD